jgi:HAD superfamily hydrolase (TIGR01509 family)
LDRDSGRPLSAVVFDLDGTLVDTAALHIAASHATLRAVLGREVTPEVVLQSLGRPLPESAAVLALGAGITNASTLETLVPRLVAAFLNYYTVHQAGMVRPFPGVLNVLQTLRERGYALGLLSNKLRSWGQAELKMVRLAPFFDVAIFAEDMPNPKPAPAALQPVLAQLKVSPGEVLLVGDGPADIACARAAGARSAAALWGTVAPEALLALEPDSVLHAVEQLLDLCLPRKG